MKKRLNLIPARDGVAAGGLCLATARTIAPAKAGGRTLERQQALTGHPGFAAANNGHACRVRARITTHAAACGYWERVSKLSPRIRRIDADAGIIVPSADTFSIRVAPCDPLSEAACESVSSAPAASIRVIRGPYTWSIPLRMFCAAASDRK